MNESDGSVIMPKKRYTLLEVEWHRDPFPLQEPSVVLFHGVSPQFVLIKHSPIFYHMASLKYIFYSCRAEEIAEVL